MTNLQRNNRYFLMRHGESLANRRGLIVSDAKNALHDYGLTAKGSEQVMQTALSTRLGTDTVIVSSDYLRTRETAEIMRSVLSCDTELILDENLRERNFGNYELGDHQNYQQVWQQDLVNPTQHIEGVEPVEQVLKRGLATIQKLECTFRDKKILLVGHGDVLQILLAHHHNINPRFHRSLSCIGNADIRSLAKLELTARSPAA